MEFGIFLQGSLFMAGLIGSLGPQNIFVLHTGLSGRHTLEVVLICIAGDFALAILGLVSLGNIFELSPHLATLLKYTAVALLSYYLAGAARRLWHPQGPIQCASCRGSAIMGACAVTFLNPHVYLDTVFLLGTSAAAHGAVNKWFFAAGAMLSTCLWYSTLGFGAGLLSRHSATAEFSWWVDATTTLAMSVGIIMLLQ